MPSAMSRARKTLSQNFLVDAAAADRLVRSAGVTRDDLVVEIGPGDGMLTRRLLASAGRVSAYEKDPHWAAKLARRYASEPRIMVHHNDIRDVRPPTEPFMVVANIPFGVSTAIVRWCLAAPHLTSATLLTQLEFARKHSGDYGRWSKLTVSQWPWTAVSLGLRVPRGGFRPVPSVDAAVLRLDRRPTPLLPHTAVPEYRRLVEIGFRGVGGSVRASLRRYFPARRVENACAAAGIADGVPVGHVRPDAWVRLFEHLLR
ncbi:23S ribosomal RNA methyltransferase Erm [Nocardia sp. NPDC004068]|uniref:23S ribosomal RNA methyltransferase Erm n=1 Tax=Nocardia sp. NPDC004068 TaxID=3364303 RepID=UPI0036B9EDE3